MRTWKKLMLSALAAVAFSAARADAAPLVNVDIRGSTSPSGPFTSAVSAIPGQTIYYQVTTQLAPVGTVNGTRTITSRTARPNTSALGYDGVTALSFTLLSSANGSFNADAALNAADGWAAGLGTSTGTRNSVGAGTNNALTDVRPSQAAGAFAGATADSLVLSGSFALQPALLTGTTITGAYGTVNGGLSYNSTPATGANTIGNKPTITAAGEPSFVSFAPLTVSVVPEPATAGLLAVAAVGLLARRRRQA